MAEEIAEIVEKQKTFSKFIYFYKKHL